MNEADLNDRFVAPTVVDYHAVEWEQKAIGIWIKEAVVSDVMSCDRGRFTSRYPFHRFKTTTICIQVRNGSCQIDFGQGRSVELRVDQHMIIPPLTAFAVVPLPQLKGSGFFVEMDIVSVPAWNANDLEMLE